MRRASIRNRLLWSLLGAVGGLWLLAMSGSYIDAHRELDQLFDAHLAQSAGLLSSQAGHELLELDELEQEELQQYAQQFAVQLWDARGRLLLRMGPAPAVRFSSVEHGFSDADVDGVRWRVFSDWDLEHGILVQMAEPHATRERLAAKIAVNGLLPLFIALPLMGAVIWSTVSAGLAPIRRIGEEVARREPGNLDPLDAAASPAEVQPLVERLNALFKRIERSIENEKRFTADAAHELRNPVAAIRAQAEASLGASDPSLVRAGLSNIASAAARLSRLVDQLLALARLDARADSAVFVELNLVRLARGTLAELAPSVIERGASLVLDAPESAAVRGEPALLEVAIRNLIENAVVHGGAGVHIDATIVAGEKTVELTIADDGPGVPADVRARLGRRFFRGQNAEPDGSGLGLSIAARIVEMHGASIRYDAGPGGRGLYVRIQFPRQR
jgi:two-component system sensor histidine kinase QseC